ncbi:hypothetical protein JL722_13699 [Aureococcus anophagefferens]|nr:hypothetical protein JL722_13699 [Aureococcus anophagefferens]
MAAALDNAAARPFEASFGVVGLGVMGSMLALNMCEHTGEKIAGYELDAAKGAAAKAKAEAEGFGGVFEAFSDVAAFVGALKAPRRIVLLVPAGKPVDACLASLRPLLSPGDCVMDGGNEWFENTERRAAAYAEAGIHYLGCGVSGGAEGARRGPSLMVGGPEAAWALMKPTLEKICATGPGGAPCLGYFGAGGAGNYVKMVHNGIEYGDMQLIGEAFALLTSTSSFLVEITGGILKKLDGDGAPLVDKVLDSCGSKGTGKWTVKEAAEQGVPAGTIAAALEARYLSSLKATRGALAAAAKPAAPAPARALAAATLENALLCAKICSYAQGLALLAAASESHGWAVNVPDVLACWQGGCIIRAALLVDFRAAFEASPGLENLLLAPPIAAMLEARVADWRAVVGLAVATGVPVPALSASLAYYDSLRSAVLPSASMIQAQRDCFGGHAAESRASR